MLYFIKTFTEKCIHLLFAEKYQLYLQDGFCYSHLTNEETEVQAFKCLAEGHAATSINRVRF